VLCTSSIESISEAEWRDSGSPFACLLGSEGPGEDAVQAERSEFIAEP
jgi:hypothetical protein